MMDDFDRDEEVMVESNLPPPKKVDPQIKITQHRVMLMDTQIFFQIYFLNRSYFIWIGLNPAYLKNLTTAFNSHMSKLPSFSTIYGSDLDGYGQSMSMRIAKRTSCPCFISFNIDTQDPNLIQSIEAKIIEFLNETNQD